MTRDFHTYVGIDLGGGKGKKTAVAVLQCRNREVFVRFVGTKTAAGGPFYDEALIHFLVDQDEKTLVAIDAPMTLTVCVRCRLPQCVGLVACEDPAVQWFRRAATSSSSSTTDARVKPTATPYTQRVCEVLLHREHQILPRETLGQGMGPLTARAHYLRRALEHRYVLNQNLIEVYPKATVHQLFGAKAALRYKRQVDTWHTRARILEQLSHRLRFEVWREGCLSNDHCFDAVIAAYTGHLWATENWQLPDQDRDVLTQDGWIWFPPTITTDNT